MECYKCGADGSRKRLFDTITAEGIVKVCEDCSKGENLPMIRKPTSGQLNEIDRKPSVYERLSKASGINPYAKRSEKNENLIRQETTLREIVDRNYREKVKDNIIPREDLIDNFHWKLMVARRMKKLTQKQVAEAIVESEAAVKMAEQGVIPNDNKIIRKLENFYKIRLSKENSSEFFSSPSPEGIDFDRGNPSGARISDIRQKARETSNEQGVKPLMPEETGYNIDPEKMQQEAGLGEQAKPKKKWIFW